MKLRRLGILGHIRSWFYPRNGDIRIDDYGFTYLYVVNRWYFATWTIESKLIFNKEISDCTILNWVNEYKLNRSVF